MQRLNAFATKQKTIKNTPEISEGFSCNLQGETAEKGFIF